MGSTPLGGLGWPAATGVNQQPQQQNPAPTSGLSASGSMNPFGFGTIGNGAMTANLAETNSQTGQMRNQLIPQFAQNMGAYAAPAGQFFQNLTNLGSPYYQQAQQSVFSQGAQQANNQSGQARQQLGAQGYGFTPSGAEAGMMGGMATGTSGSMAQNFLTQLFQNEQLQMGGAQGLSQLAQMFNPSQLTGQNTNANFQQPTNTAAEMMSGIGSMVGGIFGDKGIPT